MKEITNLTPNEGNNEELKYPRRIFLIIINEFCERFTYYGIRTILALYLRDILLYDDLTATTTFHTFQMLCYFFPLIGAIISDSWLGKFRTILYLSLLYVLGSFTLSSATILTGVIRKSISILGLLLIAVGTGGIKPCVSTFGGEQFLLPEQEKQLAHFFFVFYFSINAGSLISTYLTPLLRSNVHCFGANTCYSLAFGVPAFLMVIAVVIFFLGKRYYIIIKPKTNIIVDVVLCISNALVTKIKNKETKKAHWLDYAEEKYDKTLISDTKAVLQVLVLFIPVPLFWALFDQQGSRWTFQATRMDGRLGPFTIKPDQMQLANPLLILIFIPLSDYLIYPALAKINILKRPLQRISTGGLLASVAFVVSALLELKLEGTYAVLPESGTSQIRLYNGIDCRTTVTSQIDGLSGVINSLSVLEVKKIPFNDKEYQLSVEFDSNCRRASGKYWTGNVSLVNTQAVSYFIGNSSLNTITVSKVPGNDIISKSEQGYPQLRILYNLPITSLTYLDLVNNEDFERFQLEKTEFFTKQQTLKQSGKFTPYIGNIKLNADLYLEPAGVYTLVVGNGQNNTIKVNLLETSPPNSIHILWLLPQYIIITAAEVMFSITGLEFSFTQAPVSMKSLITAAWLLTNSFGNLIVIIVSKAKFFQSQANEFLLFAALMIIDMGVFIVIAVRYKYHSPENTESI